MPTYVRLLGNPTIKFDGEWIVPPTTKMTALLYYLAYKNHWVDRSVLTYLFWSDVPEENARNNLRKLLSRSKDLPYIQNLDVERTRLRWLTDTDFKAFQDALDTQDTSGTVQLYSGELLEGFRLDGAPEFDTWLETERQEIFSIWRETVFQLSLALEAQGQHKNIANIFEKLYKADPFDEDVLKQYLQSLHLDGQKSKALEVFKQFEHMLKEELGGEPEAATLELIKHIQQNDVPTNSKTSTLSTTTNNISTSPNLLDLGALSTKPSSPVFVARQKEMSRLSNYLAKVLECQHQVAFVLGEAGQGKSFLLQAFSQQVQNKGEFTVVNGKGNAYTGIGDPYLPFREVLELLTGNVQSRTENDELNLGRAKPLWNALPTAIETIMSCGRDLLDTFVSTQSLISRGIAHSPQGANWLSELREFANQKSSQPKQMQQSALFEQYAKVIEVLASKTPLLLLLDDMQWIDAGSANLFLHLVKRLAGSPVLIVGAYRPSDISIGRAGERHPLEKIINECQRTFGEISIDLSQIEGKTFVDELIDTEPNKLAATFRAAMLKRTGGHPLFTVELLRSLKERRDIVKEDGQWVEQANIDWKGMPALVEGVIGERIGRLATPLQEILQVASVEGEEFTAEVIAKVLGLDKREVIRQLSRELDKVHYLVKAQGIKREGAVKLSCYSFQNILIQHYLYSSLDEIEQADLNESVANAIEAIYGEKTEQVAVGLAHYYQEANIPEKAIDYLLSAGKQAARLSANEEAINHFTQGLDMQSAHAVHFLDLALKAEPQLLSAEQAKWLTTLQVEYHNIRAVFDWAERAKEVKLGLKLAVAIWPFLVAYGYSDEGSEILERLLALPQAQDYPDPELRAKAINALATLLNTKGDWIKARVYLEDILAIWEKMGDKHSVAKTLSTLGWTFIGLDNYYEARSHSKKALNLHHATKNLRGEALSLNNLGWCDILEGNFDSASAYLEQSLNILNSLDDKNSTYFILINLAWVQQYLGNYDKANELLKDAESLMPSVKNKQIIGWMLCRQGSIAYDLGNAKEALKFLEESLAYANEIVTAYHFVLLAPLASTVLREVGELKRAQRVLEDHFSFCSNKDKKRLFADGLFAKGQLLEKADNLVEAQNAYTQSLKIYQEIKVKYAVPEALESIARLYVLQSKLERACQLLARATQYREQMEFPLPPRCQEVNKECLEQLHNKLAKKDFHIAWTQGKILNEKALQQLLQ